MAAAAAAARRGRCLAALLRAGIGPRAAAGERSSAPYRAAPEPCPALGRPSPVRTKHYTPGPGSACRPGAVTTRGPRDPSGRWERVRAGRGGARGGGNRAARRAAAGHPRGGASGPCGVETDVAGADGPGAAPARMGLRVSAWEAAPR